MYLSAEKLKSGALLAPMAGVADRSMRELCMEFGAIGCIGEMASSKGISMNDRKSSELLSLTMPNARQVSKYSATCPR